MRVLISPSLSAVDRHDYGRRGNHGATGFIEKQFFWRISRGNHVVLQEQLCQGQLHFQQGESHSDAGPWSQTERQVHCWVSFDLGRESERVELLSVRAPVLGVKVERFGVDGYCQVLWD